MNKISTLFAALLIVASLASCSDDVSGIKQQAPPTANAEEGLMSTIYKSPQPPPAKLIIAAADSVDRIKPPQPGEEVAEFWQGRGEVGRYGGNLTVAIFGQGPKTFNYWASNDVESAGLCELMFDHLIDLDPWTGQYCGRLARTISISPDKKELTITLRKGLVWSDKRPITADDVIFTLNTIVKHGYGNSSYRDVMSLEGQFPEIVKVDDLTVKIMTKKPFAPILNALRICIAPKHIFEEVTKNPVSEFTKFWNINCDPKTIVCSGPFMLGRYVPGQRVELVRNPNYSFVDKAGQRLPYLEKFTETIVPDQNTEILKFYGNEIDFLDIRSVRGIDAAKMKSREESGKFKIYNLGPDDGTMFLMFNMCRRKKDGKYIVDPIKQKWFNSLEFRQACAHAMDRKRMISNVLRGVGLPLYTAESPSAIYIDKTLQWYPEDLKLAQELLSKGGFVKKGDDLYDADGHRVEFTLYTNAGNLTREGVSVMIIEELKKLGMKVNFQPIDFNIMIDKTENCTDWDSVVMGLTGDKIEPYSGANIWKSDGRLHMFDQRMPDKKGTVNVTDARPWEKEIDECFNGGATTFDTAQRHQYFDRYQAIAYQQQPFIFLYSMLNLTAMRNKVGNYMPTAWGIYNTPKGSLHNVEEIYIKGRK